MSFAEKHPYLFWQLIGWGILLIDFVFVVIAVFNDFGEWSYPIIVFTFIGALFQFGGVLSAVAVGWAMDRFNPHKVIGLFYLLAGVFIVPRWVARSFGAGKDTDIKE